MSTSRRAQKDDDVLADNGGSIEAMFADAEAELNATLNESIEDIERLGLNNQQPSEDLGTPAGASTKAPAVRSATSISHIRDDEYEDEDNDNDDDGDDGVGGYSSFDDNNDDELSLDGEIENLEGLAMEDLARELRDLESMLTIMENSGDGDIGRQETTTRPAPFEGKGRRARARRARIKREMKAREERAKAKANDLRGGKGEKHSKKEVKKRLKSLGSTSSLGRALAASQAKSSSKFDNKQGASRPNDQGVREKKGESKTNPSNNSVERSEPFQGKGRRARARRAKERREKVAEQIEAAENSSAGDTIVDEFGEKREEEAVQQMQTVRSTCTKREVNRSVAEVLKSQTFPDFSIREALS